MLKQKNFIYCKICNDKSDKEWVETTFKKMCEDNYDFFNNK